MRQKGDLTLRFVGRLILAAILFILTGLLMAVAAAAPEMLFSFYETYGKTALDAIASVTGKVSFCVWEIVALLLLLSFVYSLIQAIRRLRILSWLAGVAVTAGVLVFAFVALWGLNHYAPPVEDKLNLSVREYSAQELIAATKAYAAQANDLADTVPRDENGLAVMASFETLAAKADDGYAALSEYTLFSGTYPTVKKLIAWPLYSKIGTTGIYMCLTAEPSVNPDTYPVWLPITMCHELAHSKLVAAEDGANFCAYLACMENPDAQFRYSGAVAAFVYCNNALGNYDKEAVAEVWNTLDSRVRADILAANAHYQQYEGAVQDAAEKVNDAYLKAFSEKSGVRSYGEVADLLIAWYLKNAQTV